jgi:hypothetical protein
VYVRGLYDVRAHVYAGRSSAGHVCLCGFLKKEKNSGEGRREYWYGRPESLYAQTFSETQKKKVVKPIKNTQQVSPENPRESLVWSPILLWVGNPSYGLTLRVLSCM